MAVSVRRKQTSMNGAANPVALMSVAEQLFDIFGGGELGVAVA